MRKSGKYHVGIACALLFGPLISACTTSATQQSTAVNSVCQIIYAPIPHTSSAHVIGQDELGSIVSLTKDEKKQFIRLLNPITESLITSMVDPMAEWQLQLVEEVVGGYEGETTPSISLRLHSRLGGNIRQLERVAAAMGYVYVQDSVLVQCSDDSIENSSDAVTVVVKDRGQREFLSAENAALLFGMMIALNNTPEGLGYTYYPNTGRFETLEQDIANGKTAQLLKDVSQRLQQLSNNEITLGVSIENLEVSFPHNSWSIARQGETYLSALLTAADRQILADHRQKFLEVIDSFIKQQRTQ